MERIWLNHWFSAAYHIVLLLKRDDPDFYVIGTNENPQSPMMAVCDEWYQEPPLRGEEYVQFCLEFCAQHKIDVFLPRREALPVSRAKNRFAAAGVKVMVEESGAMERLNHKDQAYAFFRREGIGNVPEYYVATDARQFCSRYRQLSRRYGAVCFKRVVDEGGQSFRLIDNDCRGYAALLDNRTSRITFSAAMEALSERESFPPVLLMPYLSGKEVSVDCLNTPSGLIAIPRIKGATRIETIRYDETILGFCRELYAKMPLEHPCNIQFKYLDGVAYLLEVNTRMSGGIQMACAASGVNIPNIAVNKLLGIQKPWENLRVEKNVCYVESPVVL